MRKRNRKKAICLFLCGTIMVSCFQGCEKKEDTINNSSQQQEIKTEKQTKEQEAITITSFNNLITEEFLQSFREAYPEVNLKVIQYGGMNGSGYALHTLEQGDITDIYVSTQNFSKESQKQYLLDLSNYEFVNNYSSTLLDSLDIDGGIYLLPSGYTLTGIYYNKTILQENGWDVPTSFQELVSLSEKIEAAGYKTMGHSMLLDGYPFNYFFNIGNTVYLGTPEGTQWKEKFPKKETKAEGNKKLEKTANYFYQWVKKGFITTDHMAEAEFLEGNCVFFLCLGLNQYTYTKEDGTVYEFGTIPWLSKDGKNNMLTRNISRYIGINKTLEEKGQEQKLEGALKFLKYISTTEGQEALMTTGVRYMPSLKEGELKEDSPYQELADLIYEGRTVPLLYVGWENLIIPIAKEIKSMIRKEKNVQELMKAFDKTRDDILLGSSDDIYATCTETLTMEKTAQLVAIAEGKAVDADCAIISINEYHADGNNGQGLSWYLYKEDITSDVINVIRPRATTISTLELTGAEIKKMQKTGLDLNKNGKPYPCLLFTKNGIELEDDVTYKLAISTGELTEEWTEKATETEVSPSDAIIEYIRELKEVSSEVIDWKE